MHATAAIARRYELLAARSVAYEAMLQQRLLQEAVNDSVRAFRDLHEAGVDIDETLRGLRDELSNADTALRTTIDEACIHAEHLDLSEMDALIAKVRS